MRVHVALPALPALQRPTLLVAFRAHSCKWWSHGRRRLFGGTRPPQMEARMVAADTPGRAGATRTVLGALFVELGAALVPELVASTRSRSDSCRARWAEGVSRARAPWLRLRGRPWMAAAGHPAGHAGALQLRHVAGSMGAARPLARARGKLLAGAERVPRECERHAQKHEFANGGRRALVYERAGRGRRAATIATGGSKFWATRPSAELPQGSFGRDSLARMQAPRNGLVNDASNAPTTRDARRRHLGAGTASPEKMVGSHPCCAVSPQERGRTTPPRDAPCVRNRHLTHTGRTLATSSHQGSSARDSNCVRDKSLCCPIRRLSALIGAALEGPSRSCRPNRRGPWIAADIGLAWATVFKAETVRDFSSSAVLQLQRLG
jgi:hypothetical protein